MHSLLFAFLAVAEHLFGRFMNVSHNSVIFFLNRNDMLRASYCMYKFSIVFPHLFMLDFDILSGVGLFSQVTKDRMRGNGLKVPPEDV